MAGTGRIYQRGHHYYIAYRWDGREYRESARSSDRAVAERLLAQRLLERAAGETTSDPTFDTLAAWYVDDYVVRGLRTLDTARGRVANLRSVFGGRVATAITTSAIREYQRHRRAISHGQRNNSASCSDGFIQPRVCRGRSLSTCATRFRCRWLWTDKSLPRGKY